jgi:hypothetical protein
VNKRKIDRGIGKTRKRWRIDKKYDTIRSIKRDDSSLGNIRRKK